MSIAKFIGPIAAALVVHLNLEVLVAVEGHEVVSFISSLRVIRVSFLNLVGPLRHPDLFLAQTPS